MRLSSRQRAWLIAAGVVGVFLWLPKRRAAVNDPGAVDASPGDIQYVSVPPIKKRADAPILEQLGGATGYF